MGNYIDIEKDFIIRTQKLIAQYETILHKFDFEEQLNYTLLINCMLGLVVLPKEKSFHYLPSQTLFDKKALTEMGINNSTLNPKYKDLKSLIIALRHSVAHFNIKIESVNDQFHIDNIIFQNDENGEAYEVANFKANELLPFLRYYSDWLLSNLKNYKP